MEALAGWAGTYRWQRSQRAALLEKAYGKVAPELVRSRWEEIIGMDNLDYPTTHQEATMDVMSRIQENMSAENDGEKTIKDAIGFVSKPYVFNYSFKESIIYSLAVGVSTRDKDGLRFLYEDHENFAPLPTFGVIPALSGTGGLVTGGVPGLTIDLSKVLHGEQYIKILKPLPAEAKLTNTFKIQDILDKGKGMVLLVEVESNHEGTRVSFYY